MAWTISYTDSALKTLRKLDKQQARRILDFMDTRIARLDDPRSHGKALTGPLGDLWRFRVGDYRIVCDLQDTVLCVLVLKIGNRKDIYTLAVDSRVLDWRGAAPPKLPARAQD